MVTRTRVGDERLVDEQLELLSSELRRMELAHRAHLDALRLEVETLKLYLRQADPRFDQRFYELAEVARREIDPE